MNKNQLEQKFSRHIGRILHKFDSTMCEPDIIDGSSLEPLEDAKVYTKAEMWLLCQDLIVMLGMNDRNENNESKETNYNR